MASDMSGDVTGDEGRAWARRELGLERGADAETIRATWRRVARERHPDHGGDADAFDRARRAYLLLEDAPGASPEPAIRPGRPSREPTAASVGDRDDLDRTTPLDVDGLARCAAPGAALTADDLARWLVTLDATHPVLRAFHAMGRGPGARTNRIAHLLSEGSASFVSVRAIADRDPTTTGRTHLVRIEVVARGRTGRRAADGLRLDGAERGRGWTRTRGSSITTLRQDHVLDADVRITARAVATELATTLERLDWPLATWRPSIP